MKKNHDELIKIFKDFNSFFYANHSFKTPFKVALENWCKIPSKLAYLKALAFIFAFLVN